MNKCGKSSISVELFSYSTSTFAKTTFLNSSELTVTSFWMLHGWSKFWLCPLDWNVDESNMQKGSTSAVNMSIFKLNILWSNWLEFFGQDLHRDDSRQVWLMSENDLLFFRSMFYPPHWRKTSQCDCASCYAIQTHNPTKLQVVLLLLKSQPTLFACVKMFHQHVAVCNRCIGNLANQFPENAHFDFFG